MTEGTDYTLQQLRDYIGDALGDDNITPSQLVEAIETEIRDLLDYHQVAAGKARKVLDMLGNGTSSDNVFDFERFRAVETDDTPYSGLGVNIPDAFDLFAGGGDDVIKFDDVYRARAAHEFNFNVDDTISFDDPTKNKYNFKLHSKFINKDNLNNND